MGTKRLSRNDLALALALDGLMPFSTAKQAVDRLTDLLARELLCGSRVILPRFGSFSVTAMAPRIGRNPRTGQAVVIPPRRRLAFRPASSLRAALRDV